MNKKIILGVAMAILCAVFAFATVNVKSESGGSAGQVSYWINSTHVAGDNNFYWGSSNGKLGIGTTTPATGLEVSSSTDAQKRKVRATDGTVKADLGATTTAGFVGTSTNHDFQILQNNGARVTISSTAAKFGLPAVPVIDDYVALGSSSLKWSDLFLAEGGVINWDNGDVTLRQSQNSLRIDGANVEIGGTGIPQSNLYVNGNTTVNGTVLVDNNSIIIENNGSIIIDSLKGAQATGIRIKIIDDERTAFIEGISGLKSGTNSPNNLSLHAGTTGLYLSTAGGVSVGHVRPTQEFEVNGQLRLLSDSKGSCLAEIAGTIAYEEVSDVGTFYGCRKTGASTYEWVALH